MITGIFIGLVPLVLLVAVLWFLSQGTGGRSGSDY